MQTITIDMSAATTEQALKLAACIMSLQLNFTVTSDAGPDTTGLIAVPLKAAPAKPRERKPRAPKADNGGGAAILEAVEQTDGSVSAITSRLGLSKSRVLRGLKVLRDADKVFMAGDRRFARYGLTAEQAVARSVSAQGEAVSDEAEAQIEATIAAHCADFEALIQERDWAPDGLGELLVGAVRALRNTCESPVYVVPISATRYALAVRGREVVTVKINGQTIYEVEGAGLRRTVSQKGLKAALGDAILEALPVFVHAAFAGEQERT